MTGRNFFSELAQYTVHHPVGGSGADAVTGACTFAVQMIHNSLYQRELYMLGIGNVKLMPSGAVMQGYWLEGENGEAYHALVTYKFNPVLLGGFIGHKAPGAGANQAVLKLETGAYGILGLIKTGAVAAQSVCVDDAAAQFLYHINLMRGKVIEITAARYIRNYAPRQVGTVVVQFLGRLGKAYLYVYEFAYLGDKFLDLEEVGQITAVVCHKTGYSGLAGYAVYPHALVITLGHWLLNVDGLAGLHGHDGICGV